jgi:hypothetical protein
MREIIIAYKYFVGKPEETRPVGKLGFQKDNIKIDLKLSFCDRIQLSHDRAKLWNRVHIATTF